MGVRPSICTVFGIDNFRGSLSDDFWDRRISMPESASGDLAFVKDYAYDCVAEEWRWYPDVVYWSPNTSNRTVLGLIQGRDFDSITFRVLAMLYPEFFESGRMDVPVIEDEIEKNLRRRGEREIKLGDIEFRERWFYPQGFHRMTPVWGYVTKWLLDSLGVETNPDNYKWMLVWDWV